MHARDVFFFPTIFAKLHRDVDGLVTHYRYSRIERKRARTVCKRVNELEASAPACPEAIRAARRAEEWSIAAAVTCTTRETCNVYEYHDGERSRPI